MEHLDVHDTSYIIKLSEVPNFDYYVLFPKNVVIIKYIKVNKGEVKIQGLGNLKCEDKK